MSTPAEPTGRHPVERHPVARLEAVVKRFGDTTALHALDIDIGSGEFLTLLGPSGCGKSTTLRILGGFEQPTSGRVILEGRDVTRVPPNLRDVNMVFQDYALFPHMSVGRNVAFGLELQGASRSAIDARVTELLQFLELDQFRDRAPDQLSGGQRQRVALARALARDPSLLLLDEPLGALDARLRSQVQIELKGIQQRTGKTFVFVTHDQEEALTMSDRIIVMNAGRVEQNGTPETLYHHPASRFVAQFIGETNLLDVTVRDVDGERVHLDWQGVQTEGVAHGLVPEVGSHTSATLRPEDVGVHASRPANRAAHRAALAGRIVTRVFKGSRTAVEVALDDTDDARVKAYLDGDLQTQSLDGTVWVDWTSERLSVMGPSG